ncbi:MAG: hypothetical protein Q8P12_00055 [bacterium]|nr:hypothetical protein [bacterium]MDZ4232087.1 hypothetical protein [Candidatus Pacearchaeota archaeon]
MADVQITREFRQIFMQEIKSLVGEQGFAAILQGAGGKRDAADESGSSLQELVVLVVRRLKADFGEAFPERILLHAYARLKEKYPNPGELSELVSITNPAVLEASK